MKKALMVVLPVAVFAGYVGYQHLTNQEREIQLVTARVTRGDVVRGIDATGRLEAVTTMLAGFAKPTSRISRATTFFAASLLPQ